MSSTSTTVESDAHERAVVAGWSAAAVGSLSALLIIAWTGSLASTFLNEIGGWCGTVIAAVQEQLWLYVPASLSIPYSCMRISSWYGHGRIASRWAFLLAASVWIGCVAGQVLCGVIRNFE
jgi:hypothetical protein